jgi:hypothetical protein
VEQEDTNILVVIEEAERVKLVHMGVSVVADALVDASVLLAHATADALNLAALSDATDVVVNVRY